jgi:2,3-bisphosphoglycerate-dependent phosphoglycerate mutase
MMSDRNEKPTLWFVRHGESTWNASGFVQGHASGPKLTVKGRAEAARVAGELGQIRVGALYTSDLRRAYETATIIGAALGLALQVDASLRERNFGVAQGRPLGELQSAHSGIEGAQVVDADVRPENGESLREMYRRVSTFIDDVATNEVDGDVVVVTHGGVIRVAQAYDSGVAVDAMEWGPVANASVWSLGGPCPAVAVVP